MTHKASTRQGQDFWEELRGDLSPLETALDFVEANFTPQDVFEVSELEDWATENGFVKESA